LETLRAQRDTRAQAFDSLEPDDRTVQRLINSIDKQITRKVVWGDRLRIGRYIASAAAVIAISFSAGWLGRSQSPAQPDPLQNALVHLDNSGSFDNAANNSAAASDPNIGTLVSNDRSAMPPRVPDNFPFAPNHSTGGYQVTLTDGFGKPVASQHFNTLEEATEFREDVERWQRQQQLQDQQQNSGAEPVVYTKEQF
jgi:hypothetical protein